MCNRKAEAQLKNIIQLAPLILNLRENVVQRINIHIKQIIYQEKVIVQRQRPLITWKINASNCEVKEENILIEHP